MYYAKVKLQRMHDFSLSNKIKISNNLKKKKNTALQLKESPPFLSSNQGQGFFFFFLIQNSYHHNTLAACNEYAWTKYFMMASIIWNIFSPRLFQV